MSELLFECYGVPSLTSGVDALFSFYHNNVGNTGLILNCGYHTTHVVPVVKGESIFSKAKRINIGTFAKCIDDYSSMAATTGPASYEGSLFC